MAVVQSEENKGVKKVEEIKFELTFVSICQKVKGGEEPGKSLHFQGRISFLCHEETFHDSEMKFKFHEFL